MAKQKKKHSDGTLGGYFGDAISNVAGHVGDAIEKPIKAISSTVSTVTPRPAGHRPAKPVKGTLIGPPSPIVPKPIPKPKPRPVSRSTTPVRSSGTSTRSGGGRPANRVSVAPKAPSRPKTFTDGHGVVRNLAPLGSKKVTVTRNGVKKTGPAKPAAPTVDPLEAMVDKIIAGMNAPLVSQQTYAEDQARGTMDQNHRLANTYDQRVGALRTGTNTDLASAMQKAAELKGLSADTIAKNQQWLMSLMGPDGGGGGLQAAQADASNTAANLAGANDDLAKSIMGGGQRTSDMLAATQAGGRGMEREFDYQAGLAAKAQQRQLQDQISANTGQKAKMMYDMQSAAADQQLKQDVAAQEFGLDKAKFDSGNYFNQARLDLDTTKAKNADSLALKKLALDAQGKPVAPGKYGNIPKRYDAAIDSVWAKLNAGLNHVDKKGNPAPTIHAPWRSAWDALKDHGLNPNTAAIMATKWFPDSVSPAKTSPQNVLHMLSSRGVSTAVAKKIITDHFGASGWAKANSKGALGDAVTSVSNGLNNISHVLGQ